MYLIRILLLLFPLFILPQIACTPANSASIEVTEKYCGVNFVAPPSPFSKNPMDYLQQVGANWIAVCPFAYTRSGENWVRYNSQWQWWGEKPEGVKKSIELAHDAGIKVMLKPHVYIPGSWPGDLSYDNSKDWENWEKDYTTYIMEFAQMAQDLDVALFCVGVEFKKSVVEREAFWRRLIKKIKTIYDGPLTYAANWDEYKKVPFWDDLDFVGVDAYFPLYDKKTPDVKTLVKSWKPYVAELRSMQQKTGKPILFTEYGYLSVDGCAYNTWELEGKIKSLSINEQAQANALDALFTAFWNEPWWQGGFIWKWFPNMEGHEGYPDKDYTPQGKVGEAVLTKWFEKEG